MIKKLFVAMIFTFVIISCNEDFIQTSDFKEKYVLNCIINGDTTFQTATVTRNYPVPGDLNPYSDTGDKFVNGTVIRIWNGDNVAVLRDTSIARPEPSDYNTPYNVYYTNNFQPLPSSTVEIEAVLPNGKKLTSSSKTPAKIYFNILESDTLIPQPSSSALRIYWNGGKNSVYSPKFKILYYQHEGGVKKLKQFIVPLNYVDYNGEAIPKYSKLTTDANYYVDYSTISKAMELLSAGDPVKTNFEILIGSLEVLSLDDALSIYYGSVTRGNDVYSVKLDETDFSNVKGGYGVFGVFIKSNFYIRFSKSFITSFGYLSALKS